MAHVWDNASFGYLKKLFPILYSKFDVSSFQCGTCELAKSHSIPYSTFERSSIPLWSF